MTYDETTEHLLSNTIARERRLETIKSLQIEKQARINRCEMVRRRCEVVLASIEAAETRMSELENSIKGQWKQLRETEERVGKDLDLVANIRFVISDKEAELRSLLNDIEASRLAEFKAREAEALCRENVARLEERADTLRASLEEAQRVREKFVDDVDMHEKEHDVLTRKIPDDDIASAEIAIQRLFFENTQLVAEIEHANQRYRKARRRADTSKKNARKIQDQANTIVGAATITVREMRRTWNDEVRDAAIRAAHQRIDKIILPPPPNSPALFYYHNEKKESPPPRRRQQLQETTTPDKERSFQCLYDSEYITLSLREALTSRPIRDDHYYYVSDDFDHHQEVDGANPVVDDDFITQYESAALFCTQECYVYLLHIYI